ncbi:ceramide synthase Lag1p [[Candida] anglica]|uniref:Ceramide synthase Lag1p n=1 Tax=[Candida] anglica TaxID=148631 RepID=A0ABP0EJP1_9ASCO
MTRSDSGTKASTATRTAPPIDGSAFVSSDSALAETPAQPAISTTTTSSNAHASNPHSKSHPAGSDPSGKTPSHGSLYKSSYSAAIERNQIHISRLLLTAFYVVHVLYTPATPYTSKFIHLQYPTGEVNPVDGGLLYDIGHDDVYFIIFWVVTLTFLRSALMSYCFKPLATHVCKIHSNKAITRFAEQGWANFYYMCSFALGVYLYVGSPYFMSLDHLFVGWPHYQLTALFKKYYLISIAFWVQQFFVLNIEERRKDHYQMFSHHIITFALVVGSYYYYFTRIGHAILMIMDSVDIFLVTAKMLKYSGFTRACDVMFILFLGSWIILRHGVYNVLFYHTWRHSQDLMVGTECQAGVEMKRCWTPFIMNVFKALLGGLQILTMVWMYFILKVAYKVIMGKGAEDVRSDEDDTEEEHDEKEEEVDEED